jgi:replicative DNA helicase
MSGEEICRRLVHVDPSTQLYIDDFPGHSLESMRRVSQPLSPKLVLVDYLQLIRPSSAGIPREQQISEVSRGLKAFAKDFDCCVIVLSQLNRSSVREQRAPNLADLRESGAIEQDADVVLFLDAQERFRKHPNIEDYQLVPRALTVAKNRHGPIGSVSLTFDKVAQSFEEGEYRVCVDPF